MKCYVALAGGLGNQLFQYAAAVETGATEIIFLDLLSNRRVNLNSLPDICELKLPIPIVIEKSPRLSFLSNRYFSWLLGSTSNPMTLRFKLARSRFIAKFTSAWILFAYGYKCDLILEDRLINNFSKTNLVKPKLLVGYFQSLYSCAKVSSHLSELVPISLSEQFREFLAATNVDDLVGVHIRRGDYVGHPTFGLLSDRFFSNAIRSRTTRSSSVIFFSDSSVEESRYIQDGDLANIYICPSEFSASEVFYLMSRCSSFVASNSSLSWWAGFVIQSKGGEVIAPSPWFQNEIQSPKFYPAMWTQVTSEFTS